MTTTSKKTNAAYCLLTGVTGYIGGRLVPRLLDEGHKVRVMARDATRLQGRTWLDRVDVVEADVFDQQSLQHALENIDIAYYLIHSMAGNEESYGQKDILAARNFGKIAKVQGIKRIIYLGGLGDPEADLSEHLRSRQKTGETLRESGIPVTEFRAAVVVGSGSQSFEMIRYLVERVPLMVCPSWVFSKIQPIAIRDILSYLSKAIDKPETTGKTIEIGGADVMTYGDMMTRYAKVRGLKRWLIPVPVLTPRLSSYWIHWVTPIPASLARPLIEGLRNDVIVKTDTARKLFPEIDPISYETAVQLALNRMDSDDVETSWSDALINTQGDLKPVILETREGLNIERRQLTVNAPSEKVFNVICSLGGQKGWPAWNWAWKIRGIIDRMVGGVGLRRGRRDAHKLRVGDAVDFWRVEALKPGKLLRLRAEMKVPGRAWLEFQAKPQNGKSTRLIQTAYFDPHGLSGLLYWYSLYPFHGFIFSSMIKNLAKEIESNH